MAACLADTDRLPPLLAAAIAWDAWHTLSPEQQGTWRSTCLASLVLRARGKTRHLLLPVDTGQRLSRKRWDIRDDYAERMTMFFDMVARAVQAAGNELDSLSGADERMRLKIKDAPKNSRLPALADLMVAKPHRFHTSCLQGTPHQQASAADDDPSPGLYSARDYGAPPLPVLERSLTVWRPSVSRVTGHDMRR